MILIQLLELLSFPFYMLSCLEFINKVVPNKLRGTGIALYNSIGIGLGAFLGNIAGGAAIQKIGVFNLYRADSFLCIISLVICLIVNNSANNKFELIDDECKIS